MERYSDYKYTQTEIAAVSPFSIAEDLALEAGDLLLEINGASIKDIFDFREQESQEYVLLLVKKKSGEYIEYEVEKDGDEELGLEFANPLLTECASCDNHCVFCFIDQLPKHLRPSLYFKDDDSRLSFLTGNYVTLTNLSEEELERIIHFRFSPINISIHTTNPALRVRMMGNKTAGNLLEKIRKLTDSGIRINGQFVLCPGINDGEELERSLQDLAPLARKIDSLAVVPVGLTKYRKENKLFPLTSYEKSSACRLLGQIEAWQDKFLQTCGRRLIFASDEFYLLAECDFPPGEAYEGYPQLENGVGMARSFLDDVRSALKSGGNPKISSRSSTKDITQGRRNISIATGILGEKILRMVQRECEKTLNIRLNIMGIENNFFGEKITVTGLLTGEDLIRQVACLENGPDHLLLCDSMLKQDEDIFLDDISVSALSEKLGRDIYVCAEDGYSFVAALQAIKEGRNG